MTIYIPEDYKSNPDVIKTNKQIKLIKDYFERRLAEILNLTRVSAPLMVYTDTGLNDNLNGVERPVSFSLRHNNKEAEIVHSLAKWKRDSLGKYHFKTNEGLYTDMNAIRRDEEMDNIHSIYVDQWDWELVIDEVSRNKETLKETVKKIYSVFKDLEKYVLEEVQDIELCLPQEIYFITSQELEDLYPRYSMREREEKIVKKKGAVCLMEIGSVLKSGIKHDGRAPDYDDWSLNCDLLVHHKTLDSVLELSSMGIRVNKEALLKQLRIANCEDRIKYPFHQRILKGDLPQSIGGGIGQSRMCMYFLRKAHIGEVQASLWDQETLDVCKLKGVSLL